MATVTTDANTLQGALRKQVVEEGWPLGKKGLLVTHPVEAMTWTASMEAQEPR